MPQDDGGVVGGVATALGGAVGEGMKAAKAVGTAARVTAEAGFDASDMGIALKAATSPPAGRLFEPGAGSAPSTQIHHGGLVHNARSPMKDNSPGYVNPIDSVFKPTSDAPRRKNEEG